MGPHEETIRIEVGDIVRWFDSQGIRLVTEQAGSEWKVSLVAPDRYRGSPPYAIAGSELAAARAALRMFGGHPHGVVDVALAFSDDSRPAVSGDSEIESWAEEFGWYLGYTQEPDGSYSWCVRDRVDRTVLKSGTSPTLDDAKLDALTDLCPPSGEQ